MNTETIEFSLYHCDGVRTMEDLLKWVREKFGDIPLSDLKISFGIVSITVTKK